MRFQHIRAHIHRAFLAMCFSALPGISFAATMQPDTVSLVFVGDVMMHTKQLEYDYTTFLEGIRPRLQAADIAVANMEFSLGGKPYTGYPAFSAPDGYAQYVADCGVDVFLIANNHILDRRAAGYNRTKRIYNEMGKMPTVVEAKGVRIGIVNFTYATNGIVEPSCDVPYMKKESVLADIKARQSEGVDFLLAFPHWGVEYQTKHSAEQQQWAQWLASNGVDCILGGHPHVVQDTSHVRGVGGKQVPVIYSVGNCVSNMTAKNTRLELLVTVRFVTYDDGTKKMLEPELTWLWCTVPGRLKNTFLTIPVEEYIGRRSEWLMPSDYDLMMQTYKSYEKDFKARNN